MEVVRRNALSAFAFHFKSVFHYLFNSNFEREDKAREILFYLLLMRDFILFVTNEEDKELSILPTFYKQLFCMKVIRAVFFTIQLGFVNFWRKNTRTKAARKMPVKLTTGVIYANILQSASLYESVLSCFSLHTVWLCNFLAQKLLITFW